MMFFSSQAITPLSLVIFIGWQLATCSDTVRNSAITEQELVCTSEETQESSTITDWRWFSPPRWGIIADLRELPPHKYQQKYKTIGSMSAVKKLDISFDLKMRQKVRNDGDLQETPILMFQGSNTRLTLYVNGRGGFGIRHFNEFLDPYGIAGKLWLHANDVTIPGAIPAIRYRRRYTQYHVQIMSVIKVSVTINGCGGPQRIDRPICPAGEIMDILLDGEAFIANATIRNLVIKSQ